MEDASACRLVGLHAQERGQPRLFGYRTAICFLRQAGLVSLDGRGRIDGVCGCDVVGASPVHHCPCLERDAENDLKLCSQSLVPLNVPRTLRPGGFAPYGLAGWSF